MRRLLKHISKKDFQHTTVSFPFLVGQMLKYYVIKILGFNCKEREADKSLRSSFPAMTKEVYFNFFFWNYFYWWCESSLCTCEYVRGERKRDGKRKRECWLVISSRTLLLSLIVWFCCLTGKIIVKILAKVFINENTINMPETNYFIVSLATLCVFC